MKFEFYANHSHMDKNQISENENEINWFKINSFGCNIVARWLIQHWEEKHGSKSKHTEKKFKGKCWQELIRFLRLRSQFWFFFKKKKFNFHLLDLEHAFSVRANGIPFINSFDNTKLPCYTLPPTQHLSFFRNLPTLLNLQVFKSGPTWQFR